MKTEPPYSHGSRKGEYCNLPKGVFPAQCGGIWGVWGRGDRYSGTITKTATASDELRFGLEAADKIGLVGVLGQDDLDRHFAVDDRLVGAVDRSECALADCTSPDLGVWCPMGNFTRYWNEGSGKHGKPNVTTAFDSRDCRVCECPSRCTRKASFRARHLTFPQKVPVQGVEKGYLNGVE
jgi:hypothetical protein